MNTQKAGKAKEQSENVGACGILMPISDWSERSAVHWSEVKDIIERSIKSSGLDPKPVWIGEDTDIIHGRIVRNLYDFPIAVCDVSGLNPNVMFELGMRLAFRKPVVVIADNKTRLPFDTAIIDTLFYPSDLHFTSIEQFMEDLKGRLVDLSTVMKKGSFKPYLDTFGAFTVVEPQPDHVRFDDHVVNQLDDIRTILVKLEIEQTRIRNTINFDRHGRSMNALTSYNYNSTSPSGDLINVLAGNASRSLVDGVSSSWTEDRLNILVSMWEEGRTATEIARRLGGVSRNAVIGKAHRIGLKSQPSPTSDTSDEPDSDITYKDY